MNNLCLLAALLSSVAPASGNVQVRDAQTHHNTRLDMTVASGQLDLPSTGLWSVEPSAGLPQLRELYLAAPEDMARRLQGERYRKARLQQRLDQGRYAVLQMHWPMWQYAMEHEGKGPAVMSDFDEEKYGDYIQNIDESTVFMLPDADMHINDETAAPDIGSSELVAVELNPYIDDGKHWVLLSSGQVERRDIDPELLAQFSLTIQPQNPADPEESNDESDSSSYTLYALVNKGKSGPAAFTLRNRITDEQIRCEWDLSSGTQGGDRVLNSWAEERATAWFPFLLGADAPVLRSWHARFADLYGAEGLRSPDTDRRRRRRGESTSVFNVLGGRAAVRETLQMEALQAAAGAQTVPIGELKGVQVQSHPFEEMLAGVEGGTLPLADLVPPDRFLAYFAKPSGLLPFLDDGAAFIAQAGASFNKNRLNYDLKERYFARLGIDENWIRLLLEKGVAREVAVSMPDLFLIDGTDVTIIVRASSMVLAKPILTMLGITELGSDITERKLESGLSTFWSTRGDLIVFGTHRKEVERALTLHENGGVGSLGQSAELRYMLNRLPLQEATRAFFYFSDPFIRRLTGPEVKIAQLRRLRVRADLETLSAAAMLYTLDGQSGDPSVARLATLNYVAADLAERDYRLTPDGRAVSSSYGSPGSLSSLLAHPVERVSTQEVSAYQQYVDNYSSYWRRYFDPIAVRLDEPEANVLQLTTYILPLIENTVYNGLREVLSTSEADAPLKVPSLAPSPVALFSMHIAERYWVEMVRGVLSEGLTRYTGIEPTIFDSLGPGVHIAIEDADPVIALGSGDMLGAFGGEMMSLGGEAMFLPVMMSTFTRPTKILVELQDPDAVLQALQRVSTLGASFTDDWETRANFYKIDGRDAWVYSFGFFGVIKFRLGVEVKEDFLVVSNLPWSQRLEIRQVETAPLNGARLTVAPGAGTQQLPGLFASATEQQRGSAMNGMGYLYPLLLAGSEDVEDAQAKHTLLFGFHPLHPTGGAWTWSDGTIASTRFGTITHQKQPEYKEGDRAFGVLRSIEDVTLNMQFEDTGLRASCRWTLRD